MRSFAMLASLLLATSTSARSQSTPPQPAAPMVAPGVSSSASFSAPSSAPLASNLVINGDFEVITGSGCQYNMSNAAFTAAMAASNAFGAANELDIMSGACYGPPAVSGVTKVGLGAKHLGGGVYQGDEFSMTLGVPTVAGTVYTLSLWVLAQTSFSSTIGTALVTLTNNPAARGTVVHSFQPTLANTWQQTTLVFIAPSAATHITISNDTQAYCWIHVDGLRLEVGGSFPPASFCTGGTTSNGCVPTMSWSGTFSPFAPSGFLLTCNAVDGQRAGLMFYGVSGAVSFPWAPGSSSFLCVKSPVQRMNLQSSGGTAGACNGAFVEDFNTWLSTHPGALGSPWVPGTTFRLQTWFRDPPAPGTTNLSNGVVFQ